MSDEIKKGIPKGNVIGKKEFTKEDMKSPKIIDEPDGNSLATVWLVLNIQK